MSHELEPQRVWHDPVVEIYGNLITPGVRCAGEVYDLGNRRWYQLQVDSVVTDDDWMSGIIAKHIREYYQAHNAPPPWNTIKTTSSGNPVSYEAQPCRLVDRPITEKFRYGDHPGDALPISPFESVHQKSYLSRAADHCIWNDRTCVFKRIEFNVDIPSFKREIRTREDLLRHSKSQGFELQQQEMLDRFKVVPILAVITDGSGPGEPGNVIGFIMPFLGSSLEVLEEKSADSQVAIDECQLHGLVAGVREVSRCDILHGDIKFWNAVLEEPPYHNADAGKPRLLLIDLGNVAPEYPGDVIALGTLLDWCVEHSPQLSNDPAAKRRVEEAATLLNEEKIDEAVLAFDAS